MREINAKILEGRLKRIARIIIPKVEITMQKFLADFNVNLPEGKGRLTVLLINLSNSTSLI